MLNRDNLSRLDAKRITFFIIFVCMFIVTEFGRNIYRPFIYANDIFDFYVADTIGNFTGTITIIFFNLSIINPDENFGRKLLLFVTFGLIAYEIFQFVSPKSRFDPLDIIATLVAGAISFGIFQIISYSYRKQDTPQNQGLSI